MMIRMLRPATSRMMRVLWVPKTRSRAIARENGICPKQQRPSLGLHAEPRGVGAGGRDEVAGSYSLDIRRVLPRVADLLRGF